MWAMTNRHKDIAKLLLEHGASPDIKSTSGRTAFDFAAPNSEMSDYLHRHGYNIGDAGIGEDFYDSGFSQDRFEQEMEEKEMKRRMMMESSMNLEVDLSSLGMDERPEVSSQLESRGLNTQASDSRLEITRMGNKNLCGIGVLMIRCLYSKRVNSTEFWIPL